MRCIRRIGIADSCVVGLSLSKKLRDSSCEECFVDESRTKANSCRCVCLMNLIIHIDVL